jgi:methylmalonyl-CoA mutase C-terminal domain/subunit
MEVIYTGIRQTPAGVARAAIEEGVDVIGISSMVGAHVAIMKRLRRELEKLSAIDIPVILGGIIPEEDYDQLHELGASAIFPPGSELKEMIHSIKEMAKANEWISEVPCTLTGKHLDDLHLSGTQCDQCGHIYFPSRRNCPHCLDDRSIKQIPLCDEGILQTFVVASMAPPGYSVPHAQGYIHLSEKGPRIFSLLADYGDSSNLKIGCKMSLKVVRLGRDRENRIIVGYRFRPSKQNRKEE